MSKHTPGPWFVCDAKRPNAYHVRSEHRHWSVAAAMETYGCSIADKDIADSEAEANARLIAVAPDLLDALQTELECLLEDLGTAEQSAIEGLMARINRIEAVIEKAERS